MITDHTGAIVQEQSFDAWGLRRNAVDWQVLSSSIMTASFGVFSDPITTRGFTGHEMVDEVGIIHMNGRIYDPKLARFLQADPFVQSPTDTQVLNRYSYVRNNPLNATDPSGYFVFTAAAIVSSVLAAAEVITVTTAVIASFSIAFAGALYYGGDLGDAFIAGVSAAAMTYVGSEFALSGGGFTRGELLGFASLGGITSSLQGGKFGHGFVAAGLGAAAGVAKLGGSVHWVVKASAKAIIGGTISKVTGGKFANGAASGAFTSAMKSGYEYFSSDSGVLVEVTVNEDGTKTTREYSGGTIKKLFVNGQSNRLGTAVDKGYMQLGEPTKYHVFHNPTRGIVMDSIESILGKMVGPSNVAQELAALLTDHAGTLQMVASHSQGTIMVTNALKLIPGQLTKTSVFSFYGPAASESASRLAVANSGASYGQWKVNNGDFVGNVVGGGANNPLQFIGSTLAAPLLFTPFSTHSNYTP